jgi:hypothetical protein
MSEIDYLSGEFTDEDLHGQADNGDQMLDAEAFDYRLTQEDIEMLVREGKTLVFIGWLKRK